MRRSFPFHDLNNQEFEDLTGHICMKVLGTGTVVFATGADGGRDGTFDGKALTFPSVTDPYAGKFVIQAKHTANPIASCSDSEFASLITGEIPKLKKLVQGSELDHYLVFTNRKKPADKTIKKEKELKKLKLKSAHIFGTEQLRMWLTSTPKIWSDLGFDRFEKKFEIEPNDLTELVTAFHTAIKAKPDGEKSANDFRFVAKPKKNKINKLSNEYYEYIRDYSLIHFKAIENFLKNPRNEEYRNFYHDTADEIKKKIIANKSMFETFDEALTYISDLITSGNGTLKGKRRFVSIFLHYMYYTCDIGQHDNSIQAS